MVFIYIILMEFRVLSATVSFLFDIHSLSVGFALNNIQLSFNEYLLH